MFRKCPFKEWSLAIILLGLPSCLWGQEASLTGLIRDEATGQPSPCTITITDAHGKIVTQSQSFQGGFRSSGQFHLSLPAGKTRVRVTRGFETRAVSRELDLVAGKESSLEITLSRVVDLRRRGWYAGDSHVHMLHGEKTVPVDFDFIALSAQAEDLQYLSLAQAWALENPTPERLATALDVRSKPSCALTWNLEAPKNYYQGDAARCLGHCWNLGVAGRTREGRDVIRELLDASAWDYESQKPTYANFESHSLIHQQGGAVFYTHPARWWWGSWGGQGGYPRVERMRVSNMAVELPLDTLIGPTFDGLDVLTTGGERASNAKAFALWSLLLNHGYRLAATASSDACFDRPGGGVPGAARTYTFLPEGFSWRAVTRATAAGRTFATTGPLLVATIDGAPPGSTLGLGTKPHALAIEAWPSGADESGLSRVQVLRNGKPLQEFVPEPGAGLFQTNMPIRETQPAWYCVRALGGQSEGRVAVSGAFYFGTQQTPPPVPARVRAEIRDAQSAQLLAGALSEVRFEGTIPRAAKRHWLKRGEAELVVPGTVRLRAESKGHAPQTLSPFLDCPELVESVTHLNDEDLLDWRTFDRLKSQLSDIKLVFRLRRK